jgi:transcriptional regulator with XRE-family HTH domain
MVIEAEIRTLREARGWSQAALAKKAGLSMIYVQKIEAGERVPTLATLDRLARALGAELHVELRRKR